MTDKTPVTLVTGGTAEAREAAIISMIVGNRPAIRNDQISQTNHAAAAVILEGIPSGIDSFATLANDFPSLAITRIAPGCPCCMGNLTMRVTLNRILRSSPQAIYISLAAHPHLDQVRSFLTQPPYNKLIKLAKDLSI
jgi:hypothetical protein